jgi:YtoQ family protein
MELKVYLSGEIHSDWREQIKQAIKAADLPVEVLTPVTDHAASDNVGEAILGEEQSSFWKDHKAAKINSIRIKTYIETADLVVVKFGEQYKQWNAAFDAGYAVAKGKPVIVIHPHALTHALKEIDAAALAVAEEPSQVVEILKYVLTTY